MQEKIATDVLVIGAGPVGLFSVFQCGMLRLRCHVVDTLADIGGQCTALYPEKPIYDIPGFPLIQAHQLIENLQQQITPFNPTFHLNQQAIDLSPGNDGLSWIVRTSQQLEFLTKAVIIAGGCGAFGPNRPPLENLSLYEGKSVFYHVKDPSFFKNKRVVIAGGGDSAVDWALALQPFCDRVIVVHRRPKFRAAPENEKKLKDLAAQGKVDLEIPFQLQALEGDGHGMIHQVVLSHLNGETRTIPADYLLSFFGLATDLGPVAHWGLTQDNGHLVVQPGTYETNRPGIYSVGDMATYPYKLKLILSGFSEAAGAAHAIRHRIFPQTAFHFQHSTTSGVPIWGDEHAPR